MKRIITLIVTLFVLITATFGQDDLCFTKENRNGQEISIEFDRCEGKIPVAIKYSRDANKWASFKMGRGSYKRTIGGYGGSYQCYVILTEEIPGLKVGEKLYLRSNGVRDCNTFTVHATSTGFTDVNVWSIVTAFHTGDIFVSGNFNSLIGNLNTRIINYDSWRAFYFGDYDNSLQKEKNALRYNVVGIDISLNDPFNGMFYGWTNLKYIKVGFDSWGYNGFQNWVEDVAANGVFVCPRELEVKYGNNYIPYNWKVVYLDELKNISISDDSKDYIRTSRTTDIVAESEIHFYVTDRTNEGYYISQVIVTDENQNEITTEKNGNDYSFVMPDKDVNISVVYAPIEYNITCSEYVTTDINKGTVHDIVYITAENRTAEGYALDKILVNGTVFNDEYIEMKKYLRDIEVSAVYSKIVYTITADKYTYTDKTRASVGDVINLTFKNKENYNFVSANYNGTDLTVSNKRAKFTMPAENVVIETIYEPVQYNVTADEFVKLDKTKASIEDIVEFSVIDRTAEGFKLDKVFVNDKEFTERSFAMKDYLKDVKIKTVYSKISYNITVDNFSTSSKSEATIGDEITVTIKNRNGYKFVSATYNENKLSVSNNKAKFKMPAQNVKIKTVYTPIKYNVVAGDYITVDKKTATIEDKVSFTVKDRSSEGYTVDKVLVNDVKISGLSFDMKNYLKDVTIKAEYIKFVSTIVADNYSTVDKTSAYLGDIVNVTFFKLNGYNLTSATLNGTALNVKNYKSSFTMPAKDVEIKTVYTPIQYKITAGEFITVNKSTATVEDKITFTVKDRTSEGYKLDKVLVNGVKISGLSFDMRNYLKDVTIKAEYTKIMCAVTTDNFSTVDKTSAYLGDIVNVTFIKRDGYNLTSATFNGTALNIKDYKSSFTMPAKNVEIKTVYTPIQYKITAGEFITVNKLTATADDKITITFKDRTSDGYNLTSATFNGTALNIKDYKSLFTMPAKNVEIKTVYTPIQYKITAGEFITVNKSTATEEDKITFTVKDRTSEGYNLDKILVNNAEFSGTSFEMKNYLKDVEIQAVYSKIAYPVTTDNSVSVDKTSANIGDKITITVKEKQGFTPRLFVNGEEVKFSGLQYVYTVTSDKIDIKVVYDKNPETAVGDLAANSSVKIWSFDKTIFVENANSEITITDMSGHIVKNIKPVNTKTEICINKSGIYIVKTGVKTQKIIIR